MPVDKDFNQVESSSVKTRRKPHRITMNRKQLLSTGASTVRQSMKRKAVPLPKLSDIDEVMNAPEPTQCDFCGDWVPQSKLNEHMFDECMVHRGFKLAQDINDQRLAEDTVSYINRNPQDVKAMNELNEILSTTRI